MYVMKVELVVRCAHLLFSRQPIAANDLPHLLLLFDFRVALHHVLQWRQVQLQLLCQVLQGTQTKITEY